MAELWMISASNEIYCRARVIGAMPMTLSPFKGNVAVMIGQAGHEGL